MTTPNTNSSPPQLSTLLQQPDSVTQQQDHFFVFENDWLHPFLAPEEDPVSCFFLDSGVDPSKCTDHAFARSSEDIFEDEFPPSLDGDHEALFGNISLKELSDDELYTGLFSRYPADSVQFCSTDNHNAKNNDIALEKAPNRRDKLIISTALIKGCLVRVMLDTGFTGSLIISPDAATRCGIEPDRHPKTSQVLCSNVMVGDGRTVTSQVARKVDVDLGGFVSKHDALIMPLGGKFDAAVGLKYFEDLQEVCQGPLQWDFLRQQVSFKIKGRDFDISASEVPAHMFLAPRSCPAALKNIVHNSIAGEALPHGTKVLRVNDSMQLMRTRDGDDFIMHNDTLPDAADPTALSENSSCSSSLNSGRGGILSQDLQQQINKQGRHVSFAAATVFDDDDLDGSALVAKAVLAQDQADLAVPAPNPSWSPETPTDDDCFTDADFMARVDVRANSMDKLLELEREVGVDFISVLKKNGSIFRDDVPTRLVPDRGDWNGSLDFVDPADANKPLCRKPYRLSPDETRAAAQNLRDMLLRGTIRPSKSPWGTPIFLIPKSDGGWRMACDYRDLNAKLVKEAYAPPAADQLFDQLGDAKFFSSHDCTWGYHQLRWSQDSIPKTAIRTHLGTFEFLVVNFGSTSAPAQWTRLMEAILRPYLGKFVVIFLDDMCVFSQTAEDHVKHLDLVYRILAKNNIFLRFGKCFFFTRKFKFLGWVIADGKLTPDIEKIKTLADWPHPTSKREVRSFTGFTNFYKRFVSGYAKLMSPLHDLQRDEIPDATEDFVGQGCWKQEHTTAFEGVIAALTTAPAVSIANPQFQYELEVDASQVAVGGILSQINPDTGEKSVVEYYSRRLSASQRNYAPGKLELLGLIVCLEHWRHYLKGAKFQTIIHTDHEPLLAIRSTKNPSRMLLRWLDFIEQFDFKVVYRKGIENPADMLSRPFESTLLNIPEESGLKVTDCDSAPEDEPPDLSFMSAATIHWFCSAVTAEEDFYALEDDYRTDHLSDVSLEKLKQATAADPLFQAVTARSEEFRGKFRIMNGFLFWIKKGHNGLYIPSSVPAIRKAIFLQHHGHVTAGHFGAQRSAAKILERYYWPGLHRDVTNWVAECTICLTTKRKNLPPSRMFAHDIPDAPWDVVFMDEVSGFPASGGMDAIWVFVDKVSKMVHFVPIKKLGFGSEELGRLYFDHVFKYHGLPRVIVSDRDPRMTDEFWLALFRLAGVRLNMSTPMHPQTDALGEAHVKICIDMCRWFVNSNRDDWLELITALEFAHNTTPGTGGNSPFMIDGLRQPRSAQTRLIDATLGTEPQTGRAQLSANFLKRHAQVIREAREFQQRAALETEKTVHTVVHKKRDETFEPGDRVLLKRQQAGTSFPQDKMSKLYVGPFTVIAKAGKKAYKLEIPNSMRVSATQNIDNLYRLDPRVHFPPAFENSAPDEPQARITDSQLIITALSYETFEDETSEVFADTALGKFKLHELCIRTHYSECVAAIAKFSEAIRHWPFFLGRMIFHTAWQHPGFISGYDPNSPAQAFQLDFADPRDSYWEERKAFKVRQLKTPSANSLLTVQTVRHLRVLELCCGSKSFSREIRRQFPGAEVVTLDFDERYEPTFLIDVTRWDYSNFFPVAYFDIIWASPPCTEYSPAKTVGVRDLRNADRIVRAVRNIILTAQPRVWFLENPHTMLYLRDCMKDLSHLRNNCTYCRYGFKYKKDTDIWSNIPHLLKHCDSIHCRAKATSGRHPFTAQQSRSGPHQSPGVPRHVAAFIPAQLLRALITTAIIYIKEVSDEKITWK
jgi:hypothetical protein